MIPVSSTSTAAAPGLWARVRADLRPDPERWRHAARVALAGVLVVGVQMTQRYDIIYPAMTTLLVVTETKGLGTVTRLVLAFLGATLGSAAAVALMALFLQQPFLLLPVMWAYIIAVMYWMGSSRYRGALFCTGYPFIVIVYMSFFGKEHAEHIAIMVYKSVITGLACGGLVMILLWPERPEQALREQIVASLRHARDTVARLLAAVRSGEPFDLRDFVAEHWRARTPAMIGRIDQAQTDLDLDEATRHRLVSLVTLDARVAAALALAAEELARSSAPPGATASLERLDAALAGMLRRVEGEAACEGAREPPAQAPVWLEPLDAVTRELEAVRPAADALADLERRPDFGSLLWRNLRHCLPRIFRKPLWPVDLPQLQHAVKCSSTIMICALFCIAIAWAQGIGCVETVMLVVQATLGGTLLIGILRLVGVVGGYALAIMLVIWVMPIITTLPGLLAVFAVALFVVGYAMHGSPRVCVPAMQVMIVVDFAILQRTGPDISLLPAMNFSLAVAMGVVVTFIVYRLLWPVHAGEALRPLLGSMLLDTASLLRQACEGRVDSARVDRAQLRLADQVAEFLQHHAHAQLEARHPMDRCELELRLLEQVERLCNDCAVILASRIARTADVRDDAVPLRRAADRLAWLAEVVCDRAPRQEPVPGGDPAAVPAWADRLERLADRVGAARDTSRRLAEAPDPVPALLGMA
ncbi:MAG: hypothetical protein RLZZ558_1579 [Planctomycetota bacterium]|jgi:uncharacterized membrane protein YccC